MYDIHAKQFSIAFLISLGFAPVTPSWMSPSLKMLNVGI
jgi:hypothetical protein